MHPSNLGKMNGMLNSSINAKLAHIANGQYAKASGPVSLGAALAVADYKETATIDAVEKLALAEKFNAAEGDIATANDTLAMAQMSIETAIDETGLSVAEAEAIINGSMSADPEAEPVDTIAAQRVLDAQADVVEADGKVAMAQGALETLTENEMRPTESDVEIAQGVIDGVLAGVEDPEADPLDVAAQSVEDAEAAVLATYKGDATGNESEILDAVRESLPTGDQVADALPTENSETGTEVEGEDGPTDDGEIGDAAMMDTDTQVLEES